MDFSASLVVSFPFCSEGSVWVSALTVPEKIVEELKWDFSVIYDEKDAVGRRYRRQDAAGTPFCITVDHDTKETHSVTIRHRNTMEQQRVLISELKSVLDKDLSYKNWLKY